jgi:hypothetical protein
MQIRNNHLLAVISILSLQLFGCIGVQRNVARDFDPFPPKAIRAELPTDVALTVTFTASGVPAREGLRISQNVELRNSAAQMMNDTGAIRVATNAAEASYRLAIKVHDQGGGAGAIVGAVISGLTLTVLPCWVTHEYTTSVELTGPQGRVVATRKDVHSLTYISELFLVFGMPFSGVGKTHAEMWTEVLQDVSVWTAEQVARTSG